MVACKSLPPANCSKLLGARPRTIAYAGLLACLPRFQMHLAQPGPRQAVMWPLLGPGTISPAWGVSVGSNILGTISPARGVSVGFNTPASSAQRNTWDLAPYNYACSWEVSAMALALSHSLTRVEDNVCVHYEQNKPTNRHLYLPTLYIRTT